jgi:FlaA1/EpsC-like NDP-sugar epimerase
LAVRREAHHASPLAPGSPKARAEGAASPASSREEPTVVRLARHVRGRYLFAIDAVGIAVAVYVAMALRYDRLTGPTLTPVLPLLIVLLLAVRTAVNVRLGLYSRRWRYASVPELTRIVAAVTLGTVVSAAIFYGAAILGTGEYAEGFPRSFWAIELLLSVAILGGVRFGIRVASELSEGETVSRSTTRRATLLYGAGRAGVLMARSAQRYAGSDVEPVGFLDDDPSLEGGIVAGLKVFGGLEAMERAVEATGAKVLLITMPSAPGPAVRKVLEASAAFDLEVRIVPAVTELLDGSVDANRVRRVKVEDLLGRPMVTERTAGVEQIIRDRTVLITGGGGSIGSELARQVFALHPKRLVLIDRAESPLYLVTRDLEVRRRRGRGGGEVVAHLANVASQATMERIIADEAPSVIFHAAAYKHVPMMEDHPSDAAHVNIRGTQVLLDAAASARVERFVFVSTDKAVRPSSVMGASKRIAEMLVADTARRTGRPFVSVRFGNVLGSTGSVVPIFQEQLENGEPLTITHPDMTRYFMAIPEAAWLILDAAALGSDGDLFVLDMGEPVKIIDLARDLVRLAGRDPDSHPIEAIGLRPGEKLHEELFYDAEDVVQTASPKVLKALGAPPPNDVRGQAARLLELADGEHDDELRAGILAYVREIDEAGPTDDVTMPVASVDRGVSRRQAVASPGAAAR